MWTENKGKQKLQRAVHCSGQAISIKKLSLHSCSSKYELRVGHLEGLGRGRSPEAEWIGSWLCCGWRTPTKSAAASERVGCGLLLLCRAAAAAAAKGKARGRVGLRCGARGCAAAAAKGEERRRIVRHAFAGVYQRRRLVEHGAGDICKRQCIIALQTSQRRVLAALSDANTAGARSVADAPGRVESRKRCAGGPLRLSPDCMDSKM